MTAPYKLSDGNGLHLLVNPNGSKLWRVGETIAKVLEWQGAKVPQLSLDCRHSSQRVRFKLYDRQELIKRMEEFEAGP